VEVDQPWQVLQEGAQAATAGDGDKGGDDVVVVARTEEGSGGAAADGAGPGADAPGQGEEGVLLSASISTDCTLCHSLLAYRSDSPEAFLTPPAESDSTADRAMHLQLHEELRRHLRTLPTGVTTRMQGE
jgi:hypothetical protein